MKFKKLFISVIFSAALTVGSAYAEDLNISINGIESAANVAQSVSQGIKSGENLVTVTYGAQLCKELQSATTVAALYCGGVLEDIAVKSSTPIGIGGEIPHSDFTLNLPEGAEDYFIKIFLFEDYSKILPLNNVGKETSGTNLAGNSIIVNGTEIEVDTEKHTFTDTEWMHIEDNNGYVFLDNGEVAITRENNAGTSFAVITYEHGENPVNAGYSYVILPKATAEETEIYADSPDVEIICAGENVHALRDKLTDTLYINVYEGSYEINGITLPECSAIIKTEGAESKITVSDPTQKQDSLKISFPSTVSGVSGQEKDSVTADGKDITVDITARRGASYSFTVNVQ